MPILCNPWDLETQFKVHILINILNQLFSTIWWFPVKTFDLWVKNLTFKALKRSQKLWVCSPKLYLVTIDSQSKALSAVSVSRQIFWGRGHKLYLKAKGPILRLTCDVIRKVALFVLSKLWILVDNWSMCWSRERFL